MTNIDIGGIDEMEILFSILCAIFAVLASVFGVRNRIHGTRLGTRGGIRNSRARLDNIIHNYKRTERDKERVEELDARDADKLRECSRIGERIRKREQKVDVTE